MSQHETKVHPESHDATHTDATAQKVVDTAKTSVRGKVSLKQLALIHLGILMVAVGIYFFKAPNGFATGGVSGVAIILAKLKFSQDLHITQSIYMLAINVALLIVGVIVLGKKCGIMTIYCSLMLSITNILFEELIPIESISGGNPTLSGTPILELIYAIFLTGIGSAILFRNKASSGGTDIVALILKKYSNLNVSQSLLATDFFIALSTFFVYNSSVGLYAMLGLFAKVFVVDDILDSMNMCKSFTIITTKADEIEKFILEDMNHSATALRGEGVYSREAKDIIMTVCKRSEALRLRRKVKEIDPGSFIIITKSSEIMGKGFQT